MISANTLFDLILGGLIGWALYSMWKPGRDYKRGYNNGYTIGKMDAHIEMMKEDPKP